MPAVEERTEEKGNLLPIFNYKLPDVRKTSP